MSQGRVFLTAAFFLLLSSPSFAGLTFTAGNNPQPDEENILLTSGDSGTVISGTTNQTGAAVDFSSTTDILVVPSSGQARIEAQDGALNNITISTPGGVTYMDFIGNPFNGTGTMKLTVVTDQNIYVFDPALTLGNGQNFFTIVADGGEVILSTTIDAAGGFADLRQPRISGVDVPGDGTVPEPATVFLMGLACAGLAPFALRRRAARTSV